MAGFQRLAFRDIGHFYPPLYQFVGDADSFLPLWNPFDHTGIPIAGETTTALFYPPRLVFSLGLPTSVAMGWYVAIHLVLAVAASTWVARTLGCSREASLVSGIVYAFSGPVIFLYCNPPFLVGAAWLPFALGGALQLAEGWSAAKLLITTVGLAMSTLGGDPQTTVHLGMIVGATLLWRSVKGFLSPQSHGRPEAGANGSRHPPLPSAQRHRGSGKTVGRRPYWLPVITAAVLAGMLAAPQIAAALDWSRHSARRYEPPPGVSRLLAESVGEPEQRWWQPPPPGSHAADVYQFSIAPWHWLDLFVPKLSGELFPEYQRLSALIPADRRVWAITLYLGVVPLLLIVARYVRSGANSVWRQADVWDALIPIGIFLSLGVFGPVWFWKTVLDGVGITTLDPLHDALFSPYWTAVTTVPGYGAFRYPAKWLPVVMLGCSVATARGLSQLDEARQARMQRAAKWVGGIGLLSALTAGVLWLGPNRLTTLGAVVPPDSFWGPLAVESAVRSVFFSSLHVVFCAMAAVCLLRVCRNWSSSYRVTALGGLLCLDMLVAGYGQVATIDRRAEQRLLERLGTAEDSLQPSDRLIRSRVGTGWPAAWSRSSNPNRLLEVETSGRHVLFGRWHLERSLNTLNAATSIVPQRTQSLWPAAQQYAERLPVEHRPAFWKTVGRVLAVDAFVVRGEQGVEQSDARGNQLLFADRRVRAIDDPLQKVRWHDRWETVPSQTYVSKQAWEQVLARWYRDAEQYLPIVESDDPSDRVTSSVAGESAPQDVGDTTIRVSQAALDETAIEVVAARRGLLLLSRYQDGNWQAHVRQDQMPWQRVNVYPVDYLGQGIILPKGHWQVRIRYRPKWFVPSLVISALGVLFLAGASVALRRRAPRCGLLRYSARVHQL